MDVKRGVQRVREVVGGHVLKQAGNDHRVWEGGGALMTYSWTVLAPRGHWEYTKQMQTEGRMGRSGGG